ncbi:MAG: hypothetical protein CMG00_01745 [Candidatus Marinimicrobia bacterium]|nr:hypothetical protein [Candidatus Neomarinimicrobiota bacterium]|tara:strand:+ start:218 stop:409 length:192 start_codon:yes stop_codon:yes gene_type:complete
MFLNFISFLSIVLGICILGLSAGIVLGSYFENNNIDYFVYVSAFLAGLGSIMVIFGALRDRND